MFIEWLLWHLWSKTFTDNPFHNFEHASHVVQSTVKLLGRIIAPDISQSTVEHNDIGSVLHDHTYGITSDPLTQFACVFSALIHDVDHRDVPNSLLVEEDPSFALLYQNKSIVEQHSIKVAWDMLMGAEYANLRHAIYQTEEEQTRFRKLVVISVVATDIADADLKKRRNDRWDFAFSDGKSAAPSKDTSFESSKLSIDRKATIVIEHLIQASDVAHTMQHWHIYRRWNECLFMEMGCAYENGRTNVNPSDFWFAGEIAFFDRYVIPLAKKLSVVFLGLPVMSTWTTP